MKARCFGGSEDNGLTELPEDAAWSGLRDSCAWIDVEDFEDDELANWLKSHDFSPRAASAAVGLKGRTRVLSFGDEVVFELPVLASDIGSKRVPLAFHCRPNLCVTLHREPVEGLTRTANQFANNVVFVADTSTLAGALLAGLSTRAVDAVDEIRRRVLELQDRMDRDPSLVEVAEIQEHSSSIRTLDAVIGERTVALGRLQLLESPTLNFTANRDFRSARSDTKYLERVVDRLEKRVGNVREQYGLHQQDRTNRRLAVLTVLSAIFLPLTLIAGIYGMNFEVMPELGYRYAYPLAIAAMLGLGIGMVAFFRFRGWFD